jgi:hypothetical protein
MVKKMGILEQIRYGLDIGEYYELTRPMFSHSVSMGGYTAIEGDICQILKAYVDSHQGTRTVDFVMRTGDAAQLTYSTPLKLFRQIFKRIDGKRAEKVILVKNI